MPKTMEEVNRIKADIAALPKEYRMLVQAEQTWAAAHPVQYGLALFGAGVVATALAVWAF